MKVLCKILGLDNCPASDGSIIPRRVIEEYLASDAYKKSVEEKSMISSLTHRCRNLSSVFPDKPNLQKTVGKDDSLLIVGSDAPAPTHVVTKLYIDDRDNWLYGEMEIFSPEGADQYMRDSILRLTHLLRSGVKIHTSCVVVAYWNQQKNGTDEAKKIVAIKGVDITLGSSWKDSHIVKILEDENATEEQVSKNFSEVDEIVDYEGQEGVTKVKCFSNVSELGITAPKTSKIDNQFSTLKAKSFSSINPMTVEAPEKQKEFSQAHVIERVRLSKMGPRLKFRRLIIDYRQALKSQGGAEKIDPDTLKIMKSLFTTDLLGIMQEITPQVLLGKNLNALLGASALGVEVRKAAQALQVPYKLALIESQKQGFVSKVRYQKIRDAYTEFAKSVLDYVFNSPTSKKLVEEENVEGE